MIKGGMTLKSVPVIYGRNLCRKHRVLQHISEGSPNKNSPKIIINFPHQLTSISPLKE